MRQDCAIWPAMVRCAFVANMFENTRTTFTNRIAKYHAWNMPYHVKHHTLIIVPFRKPPELLTHMVGAQNVTPNSNGAFTTEYARQLT